MPDSYDIIDHSFDVVVLGAGGAGLRATLGVVLVCKTDRRSARAATELLAAGLRDVAVLRGGTVGWHRQGLALE
jgi:rhodanese-related sulfurtransferase